VRSLGFARVSLSLPTNHSNRWLRLTYFAVMAFVGGCVLNPFTHAPSPFPLKAFPAVSARSPGGAPEKRETTLLFVGDVMLSRGVGARMENQHDWTLPFQQIAETLRAADLRFCNLECPVSNMGRDLHHLYSFRADPRALEGLTVAGFNVVSQANNHTYDWGPQALIDSVARLRVAGIHPVGAGQNSLAAHYPVVVSVDGLRVAFLAYVGIDPKQAAAGIDRPGVAWLDAAQALADIRFARPLADLVIVCPHWGAEYALQPARDQVDIAHQMIDAGADMIVGSHPHVVQPVERYHDRWIAYSLGNFVFDQMNPATHRGLMLKATVRDKCIIELVQVPITINSVFQATLDTAPGIPSRPILAEHKTAPIHGQ
jgi:poly-gamma-glutamate capsule biosynthesis protein CapA/YwtB (metallophosphatase superfamily)